MKRVLLLGATGFIGSRVLQALRVQQDLRIMVLGHRQVPYRQLEDVNLVVGSLTRFDPGWLERFEPDTVIHAARLGGRTPFRRSLAARRGRRANDRLVEWLAANAPETRVVYVSGTLVYGDRGEAEADETAALRPTAFARQYVSAEVPWMDAQRTRRLRVTIVRPPWVVGGGSWLHAHYLRPAVLRGTVPVYGAGSNWMTFLDVDDCAGAIVHLASLANAPDVVNLLAPDQSARQSEFAEMLADLLGRKVERIAAGPAWPRDRAVGEALTTSLRATTAHPTALERYQWQTPHWPDMLARHAVVA